MQENHSFDNYFGTYPGRRRHPDGRLHADRPRRDPTARVRQAVPHRRPRRRWTSATTRRSFRDQYNDGQMDGFVDAIRSAAPATSQDSSMGYYDDRDIPFYWNVADDYVLFDRFFTSAHGGSVSNHMYWVTGTPGNPARASRARRAASTTCRRSSTASRSRASRGSSTCRTTTRASPSAAATTRRPRLAGRLGAAARLRALPRRPEAVRATSSTWTQYYEDLRRRARCPAVALHRARRASSEHPPGQHPGRRALRARRSSTR